jgi:hypothetical protein
LAAASPELPRTRRLDAPTTFQNLPLHKQYQLVQSSQLVKHTDSLKVIPRPLSSRITFAAFPLIIAGEIQARSSSDENTGIKPSSGSTRQKKKDVQRDIGLLPLFDQAHLKRCLNSRNRCGTRRENKSEHAVQSCHSNRQCQFMSKKEMKSEHAVQSCHSNRQCQFMRKLRFNEMCFFPPITSASYLTMPRCVQRLYQSATKITPEGEASTQCMRKPRERALP